MSNLDLVTNYLHGNYYNDCERMAKIKMIAMLAIQDVSQHDLPALIDKVALFNSIEKSYPPKKSAGRKIIEGVGFILYGP